MATIFADQIETGSIAWIAPTVGGATASTSPVPGPWGIYAININGAASVMAWSASPSTFYGQARFYLPTLATGAVIRFFSQNGTVNTVIQLNAAGRLEVARDTTVLGTGTTVLGPARWYYIQFYFLIHDSTGEATVKLDGVTEITVTGADTRNDAAANGNLCDRLELSEGAGSPSVSYKDVIINDTTDTDNVSYPDRIGIEALMGNAAGDVTGLSRGGTDSGSNFGQTDERPPNDATDYVFDSVVNDYDLYNLPATRWDSVAAVVLALRAQNSDAGAGSLAHMVKVDTDGNGTADTENQGADVALSTSWVYHSKIYNRQPGATSWSPAKVNALQAGAKCR